MEVEKTIEGIKTFLDCNGGFHDYRLEGINYVPGKDMCEVFLKFDTRKEGCLLRFIDLYDIHPVVEQYYESHWLIGSGCFLTERDTLIWADDADAWSCYDPDKLKKQFDEIMNNLSWVEAKRLFWAVTDGQGNPVDPPEWYTDQTWEVYGKKELHHFDLKEFNGDWNTIFPSWF